MKKKIVSWGVTSLIDTNLNLINPWKMGSERKPSTHNKKTAKAA